MAEPERHGEQPQRWWAISESSMRDALHRAATEDPELVMLELLANTVPAEVDET